MNGKGQQEKTDMRIAIEKQYAYQLRTNISRPGFEFNLYYLVGMSLDKVTHLRYSM